MGLFLQWGLPIIVLLISLIATVILPVERTIQVIAPLSVGIIIWILNRFLAVPNVVIEDLGKDVAYHISLGNLFNFWVPGVIINHSYTGAGEIRDITLRIFVENSPVDVPILGGEPDFIGYRLLPNGCFPGKQFQFESRLNLSGKSISGKNAEVRLRVVGQESRVYRTKISGSAS